MLWFILIVIVVSFFLFGKDLNKDNGDLAGTTLDRKFSIMVNLFNASAYGGAGRTHTLDKRSFNLYRQDAPQIFNFNYSTGHLTVTWKFKYYQQEVVHRRQYNNVRNITDRQQETLAQLFIEEALIKMNAHMSNIDTQVYR